MYDVCVCVCVRACVRACMYVTMELKVLIQHNNLLACFNTIQSFSSLNSLLECSNNIHLYYQLLLLCFRENSAADVYRHLNKTLVKLLFDQFRQIEEQYRAAHICKIPIITVTCKINYNLLLISLVV